MKSTILALILAATAHAAVCTYSNSGSHSFSAIAAGTWSCGHVPGTGDSVLISGSGTFTFDQTVTIGEGANGLVSGSGTISKSGNNVNGSSTAFTSQVEVGDLVVPASGNPIVALTVPSNVLFTCCILSGSSSFSGVAYSVRRHALYATVTNLAFTAVVTFQGDVNFGGSGFGVATTVTFAAGAGMTLDNSTAGGNPYAIRTGAGEGSGATTITATGTSGSHVTISATSGQSWWTDGSGTALSLTYADLSGFGDPSTNGGFAANLIPGGDVLLSHCTFSNWGATLFVGKNSTFALSSNLTLQYNRVISATGAVTAPFLWFKLNDTNGAATGTRLVQYNDFETPTVNIETQFFNGTASGYTVQGNFYNRIQFYENPPISTLSAAVTDTTGTSISVVSGALISNGSYLHHAGEVMQVVSGGGTSSLTVVRGVLGSTAATHSNASVFTISGYFDSNLFVQRPYPGATGAVGSFVGDTGSFLTNTYFVGDEGPALTVHRFLQSNDSPSGTGVWVNLGYIYEITSPSSTCPPSTCEWMHAVPTTGSSIVFSLGNIITPPTATGLAPAYLFQRTTAPTNERIYVNHATLMTSLSPVSSGNIGAVSGPATGGTAQSGVITAVMNALGWAKATSAEIGISNILAGGYRGATTTANEYVAAGVTNNAHYNATTGTIYDQTGANGTSALGYDGMRQTTKPTLANDINLGTGSNEKIQGPRFADTTRNFATFDTAYLGNTATAWVTSHSYSVGDIVSASSVGWYGGATINYRCVTSHTSSAGDTTNGMPGSTAATAYRTNWEFAAAQDIRAAILSGATITDGAIGCAGCTYVQAMNNWVRAGYVSQNPALWCAANDGLSIGAVDFCAGSKVVLAAIQ